MKPTFQNLMRFAALLILAAPARANDEARPQYVFINMAPGIAWRLDDPASFNRAAFDEVQTTLALPSNPRLRLGLTYAFWTLNAPVGQLAACLRNLLEASEQTNMPVLLGFDGALWWDRRPDLWNWWDPEAPGYDPANAHNVEWTDWTPESAVKIGWRNWGSQIRVRPQPNLASPSVVAAHLEPLRELAAIVAAWRRQLPPEKKHLLGGVRVGHEAGIGYNAYHYPNGNRYIEQWPSDPAHDPTHGLDLTQGLSGGCAQLGYAAVSTAGIKHNGALTRDDLARVVHAYLETLAKAAHETGLPRELIFTHQGGTYPPWGLHYPFWPAMNQYATPGWSFYGQDPAACEGLAEQLDARGRRAWAAAEWWWGAADADGWHDHFARTLGFHDCRFVAVFNWNCGFKLREQQPAHEALRRLFRDWPGAGSAAVTPDPAASSRESHPTDPSTP